MRKEPFIIVDKQGKVVDYARSMRMAKLSCVHAGDTIYKKMN